jgi:Helix-turn-helix domain
VSEPSNRSSGIQVEVLQSLLEPLLDLLADKIVERMNGSKRPAEAAEKLLTPAEAAALLGGDVEKQIQWLYRHSKQLPFTRKLSRKCIRFNESGLRRWMAARK